MAFDTPLEADRPGELNLLNALVRAPVVGTLMWIFGGDAARAEEAQLQDCSATITTAGSRCASSSSVQNSRLEYEDTLHDWPDMDTEMNMDGNGHHNHNKLRRGQRDKAGAASATAALAHIQQTTLDPHINDNADDKARRQMSWSDESGQSLVEYFDENVKKNTALHNEPPSNSFSKPLKSAMRVSKKSLRRSGDLSDANDAGILLPGDQLPQDQHYNQNLHQQHSSHRVNWMAPSSHDTNSAAHAVFAPTNKGGPANGGSSSANGGYISPQWGWYISTTPPVEKFDSGKSKKSKKKSARSSSTNKGGCDASDVLVMCTDEDLDSQSAEPAPTFTKGIKGMGKLGKVGYWPSIPL